MSRKVFVRSVSEDLDLPQQETREIVQKVWVKTENAKIWLRDIDEFEDDPDSLTEERLRDFINAARIEYNKLRNAPPIRTGVYMLTKPQKTKKIDQRFYEDGSSIFNHGYKNGRTVLIDGQRGSGKSHLAIYYIMVDCLKLGMKVVGNIPLLNLDKILRFQWKIALGDTLMDAGEFFRMVKGLSGIVKMRDQYLYLNPADLLRSTDWSLSFEWRGPSLLRFCYPSLFWAVSAGASAPWLASSAF